MKKFRIFPAIMLLSSLLFYSAINNVSAQCTETFDGVTAPALPAGWSAITLTDCAGSNPWVTSTTTPNSAPNSVFVTAPGCVSDEVFVSRYFSISSATAQLTFRRKHGLELNWDGLVLEISIGGGSFVDILAAGGDFTTGGYNATLQSSGSNPIRGRQAWTGSTSNAFVTTTVNLPSSSIGKIIVLRWRRGTDGSTADTGVFIDNVSVTGCTTSACAENFDGLTIPALPSGWIAATALDCVNSNPWLTISSTFDSSPNSVFVNDPDCISDEYLYSKIFPIISTTAQVTFRRNNNLELNYDGMVLEISIGGAPFTDILLAGGTFVTGGYDNIISNCCGNPLSSRSAWTGNSAGWITTTINLPATANGKNIILRWRRGTDNSEAGTGAYIDGLSITGSLCNPVCGTNITLTPAIGSLCSSNPIVLTASVAGAVYDWYRNDVKINGVTGNNYTATIGGIYYVRSIIGGCLVTSNVAVLEPGSVIPAISGGNGVYCLGSSVNIGVVVTETDQQYTWKKNGVIVYGPVSGNGGALSLSITMSVGTAGDYLVEATKPGCTTVVSNVVSVRLPELVTGLSTVKVCPQEVTIKWNHLTQEFITQNYEYQLSQSATPPFLGTQTTDSAVTIAVSPSTQYYFYVRYYCNGSGSVNWTSISFTTPALSNTITLSPGSGAICNNTILLTATGNGVGYEWYRDNILIDGATGTTYNANSGGTYTVKSVANECTIVSNNAVITETTMVSPSLAGAGVYCTGALVDLRSTTVPTQNYAWYLGGTLRNGPIGGGNGGNQSLPVTMSSADIGNWVVISSKNGCGSVTSNTVNVNEAKVTGLNTTAICSNQVSFSWNSIISGENYQYVVDQNSEAPSNPVNPGVTSSTTATVSSLLPSTTYYIHMRAASGPDYTSFCSIWTNFSFTTLPGITLSSGSGAICSNGSTLLTATGSGTNYEWYRDNNLITGATGNTYTADLTGTYKVILVNNGCTIVSNNAAITQTTIVAPIVDLGTTAVTSQVYCTHASVEIRVTNYQTSQEYTWYRNGSAYPPGGNGGNQSLQIPDMSANEEGDWVVISTKQGCGNVQSNTVHIDEARVESVSTTLICPAQVSFVWSFVAPGEHYQYVVTQSSSPPGNPVNPSTTTATQAVVSSLLPATMYYFHIRAASGPDFTTYCSTWTTKSFTTPSNSSPPATAEWIGAMDNVWTNTANWKCGLLPGITSAVVIDGGLPNYPVVTSNVTVRRMTLTNGASVQVNAGVVITVTSQ